MTCSKCGIRFRKNRDKSGYCPPSTYLTRNCAAKARLRFENPERLNRFVQEHPCVDCGEPDPVVLEFDHLSDKEEDVSTLLARNWKLVLAEIAKCEVRCANCHRRVTAKRANWTRHRLNGNG